jgi:hypothetical protein
MRTKARIDANQPELVKFIREMGASFQHTHQIPGCLDGIIGYRKIDVRVEIKDPNQPPSKRKLTPAEIETVFRWNGRTPEVIETENDVTRVLGRMVRDSAKLRK